MSARVSPAQRLSPGFGWSWWPVWRAPSRWSLARQYLLTNLVVVLGAVLITGAWIGHQIESSVLDRTGGITALYIDSVLGPHLQALAHDDRWLTAADTAALDKLVADTGLGEGVVMFKIWSLDGRLLYCSDRDLVGQKFPVEGGLARAVNGEVSAEMTNLDEPENVHDRERFSRLVSVYAPVRQDNGGEVIAVNEFYLLPGALDAELRTAQLRSWAVVGGLGLLTYLVLAGIVKRGSDTIRQQRGELERRVEELQRLLAQNARLHERVLQAGGRTTALNEQTLRRISADLHDGPGQALALALLRLDALQGPCDDAAICQRATGDFATVHGAVRDALAEVRAISAGLRLPQLEPLSLEHVAERAVSDHERRSGTAIARRFGPLPEQAPLPIKIALLRTLQEALSNATRHAGGHGVSVTLSTRQRALRLAVTDQGPGFDPHADLGAGHLGLAGMRERAELLGGDFEVRSAPGQGTTIEAAWPLSSEATA